MSTKALGPRGLIGHTAAAERLGIHKTTLYSWRFDGKGPRYYTYAKRIWYDPKDIDDFLNANIIPHDA